MPPLNKDDFSEEVWAEIEAEIDRARTQASQTATKNAERKAKDSIQPQIDAALEAERQRLEMNEQEKLEADRKVVEAARLALAAEAKGLKATKKLTVAGIPEDAIETLLPMFVGLDDKVFDASVDSFIALNQNLVKTQVDSVRQKLLTGATPPALPTGGPVDAQTAANEMAKTGNVAAAIDLLLGAQI